MEGEGPREDEEELRFEPFRCLQGEALTKAVLAAPEKWGDEGYLVQAMVVPVYQMHGIEDFFWNTDWR